MYSICFFIKQKTAYEMRISDWSADVCSSDLAFGIFLLRQTFKTVPRELEEAARMEGAGPLQVLMKVYVPLARPIYVAYGLVSVSHHWNNFLWPLIITNSVESRPLTVGLQVFAATDPGLDWSVITAATLLSAAPLLVGFLLFQRPLVPSFLQCGRASGRE